MTNSTFKNRQLADRIYLILAALFICSLVVSNLIFQKFFYWYPVELELFGEQIFELSVGILPYPITFLITDIVSEIYGRKRANQMVTTGIIASFFSLLIVYTANSLTAVEWSPVDDAMFSTVFGATAVAVFASMMAYLLAQYIDIYLFHYWKRVTKGKHLWIRNNFSTFSSQIVDTFTVLLLLCSFGKIEWSRFAGLLASGVLFKVIVAAIDTPLLYVSVYMLRKKFGLKNAEEIPLETFNTTI